MNMEGRRGTSLRMGSGGYCVCPKCGKKGPHQRGIPCQDERCPTCGVKMLREGSDHYLLWLKKKKVDKGKE